MAVQYHATQISKECINLPHKVLVSHNTTWWKHHIMSSWRIHDQLFTIYTSFCSWTRNFKIITVCSPLTVDSYYFDSVGLELIGQCQRVVRAAAASCIHWVSRCHCWFILNLIANGSIRVEWGEPIQFNSTPNWYSNHGQHARRGGRWGKCQ